MALNMGAEYKRDVRSLVTSFLVLFFSLPALAFEEVPASALRFGEAADFQRSPSLANDGDGLFLAVWTDFREGGGAAVYGARIDGRRHTLIDPVGVRLLEAAADPVVAYGGQRFLIVDRWLTYALVDREARVLVRGKLDGESDGKPSIVYNGRDFLVFHGRDAVHVTAIDTEGRIAGEPATIVPASGSEIQLHDAATYFQRQRIVVLYSRGEELFAAVLSATGAPLADHLIAEDVPARSSGHAQATVAGTHSSSGTGFLVAWRREAEKDVMAWRLDENGQPLGSATRIGPGEAPELVDTGGELRLYVVDGGAVRVRRIGVVNGIGIDVPSTVIQANGVHNAVNGFAAAYGPGGTLALAELYHSDHPARGSELRAGDEVLQGTLTGAGRAQYRPAIAHGREGTVVAWQVGGSFLGGEPFLETVPATRPEQPVSIAVQAGTYLIVRGGDDGVRGQLVRRDGPVGPPIELGLGMSWPVVAASGSDFIVAYASSSEITLNRVSTSGAIVARNALYYNRYTGFRPEPGLACDGGECIVAWRTETLRQTCPRFSCVVVDMRVLAVRFDESLVIRDAEPLVLTPDPVAFLQPISAAAHDGRYGLTWPDRDAVQAVTLDRNGAVESSVRIAGTNPAVARQQEGWLLVREVGEQLVGRWLASGFERVLTPADGQARRAPSLFSLGDRVLLVYERTTRNEAAAGVPRAYVTTIEPPAPRRRAASFR
jgi:hypothetical protein